MEAHCSKVGIVVLKDLAPEQGISSNLKQQYVFSVANVTNMTHALKRLKNKLAQIIAVELQKTTVQ